MEKTYKNEEITVYWKPEMCTHSTNCWKGLISVFNPKGRPWVNLDGADVDRIKNQIMKCPSGALSFEGQQREVSVSPGSIIAKKEPAQTFVEEGKNYAWCACGRSVDQPFCDGTHNRASDLKPRIFKPQKSGEVWLCQCKQTSNPPYCDGTHNTL